jgi:anaphase-promoting complex subunit 1
MFTFGSMAALGRETYSIPKMEFSIRLLPQNVILSFDQTTKLPVECTQWGDFHNGVAAGLRIAPSATAVSSSWIAFNKPSELTPEHAGFLFALGLNGHLRDLLTWHTFHYLTPKHDLTSIGILLGLSAAHVGSGDEHVTKLLAIHTPALLPTPNVDLNVSLMTQTSGLAGIGLLYMGTKNRRMAEVCLTQLVRHDLIQPDLSNEHREAYTLAGALAFGMIMLGKGAAIPADTRLLERLQVLVHGESPATRHDDPAKPHFDLNLSSPAATIAIGLMYLRTGRRDVANMLTLPDTTVELNAIQPSFLMIRAISKSLVMWDEISPTKEWVNAQIPVQITKALDVKMQGIALDDSLELAYYNILAGITFSIGLKYAGTAREEAYLLVIGYYDLYSRLAYTTGECSLFHEFILHLMVPAGTAFDSRIKRATIREGLNIISIALCMIMAGTGEINCLRRLRYAYGLYNQPIRYGTYLSTHLSLGLLFLGGGRFTLGTSDVAIAAMVTAFYPRFAHVSSDNKCYLQALRHLWVLAVEPRCLIARDVDTKEVVYLPIKIKVKGDGGAGTGTTQLISPTLIPDLDRLLSIRVDTPRYWPFYLDIASFPRHRTALLRSQTLYVKRRTAFLSYIEDPKGSRSLFVRSGAGTGEAAALDYPQVNDVTLHPAGDIGQFIGSFSNDIIFLAFADHLCRGEGDRETNSEKLFRTYAHASLLDAVIQDKPQSLQSLLTLYQYRRMTPASKYFVLRLQDLRFAMDFYEKTFEARFSGQAENASRPPLLRASAVGGAMQAQDEKLEEIRADPKFKEALARYVSGAPPVLEQGPKHTMTERLLAWYLARNNVPPATVLTQLKALAHQAYTQCVGQPPPQGTGEKEVLELGIKQVVMTTGMKLMSGTMGGLAWSTRSVDEIFDLWKQTQ